jgi:hypothetical protein
MRSSRPSSPAPGATACGSARGSGATA